MAGVPATVLIELSTHLQAVNQDPATPLDTDLMEKCELLAGTPEYLESGWPSTQPLFVQLATLLPKLQQDPSSLVRLIIKLTAPYRFEDVKDVDFESGLDLNARPFHELILSLLEKATASSNYAQMLANRASAMFALVRLWLCTPDTGVASRAADLLVSLLRVSINEPNRIEADPYGSGPIWRRLFNDRDVYALYYQYTSLKPLPGSPEPILSKNERTIAQARLLEWLPRVGTMSMRIMKGSNTDIERAVGLEDEEGLLQYATMKMVDTEDDLLMHMTLINFFSDFITTVKTNPTLFHNGSSMSLMFMQMYGLHDKLINFYTTDNPGMEHSFLSGRVAHYISEYASHYPEDFEASHAVEKVRKYIHRNIRNCNPNDLSILASMPRRTLTPRTSTGLAWDDCVLLDVPLTRTNPDALKTLAAVFHGPAKEPITLPLPPPGGIAEKLHRAEQFWARLLVSLYYTKNPNLFSDIVAHADTIAMKDNALAALTLLRALITSDWDAEHRPDNIPEGDPIYLRLQQFPKTGLDAILDPTISGAVLPYLMKPATTFSNLVGGRGDAENAAYQVAMAKFDVVKELGKALAKHGGREDIMLMVRRRVAEGPWGVGGSAGSRIGTLEL